MAHNLNFNFAEKRHAFFSVKEKAWHGLGKIVQDFPTSAEAIQHALLNYHVEKRPIFSKTEEENYQTIKNKFATVRTDTQEALGIVGKDYQVVQNKDAFSFFDAIVGGEDGILYETAGALGNGERIFITAKLPDYIKVGSDDLIEKYLFLTNSHDGSGSIEAAFTPVRIVCNNTLNAALRNCTNRIRIRHSQNVEQRLKQAHQIMGITNQFSNLLGELFNHWSRVRIDDVNLKSLILQALSPSKEVLEKINAAEWEALSPQFNRIVSDVYSYAMEAPSQQLPTTKGTVFGAYNAVTGYFQNVRTYKNEETKLNSIFEGTAYNRSQQAFELCNQFDKKGYILN